METRLHLEILPQPDDTTCGPTCLHAVYGYYGDSIPLEQVVAEVPALGGGGTLDVHLANHALRRGYLATIYTYNLRLFDPSWFSLPPSVVAQRLQAQRAFKGGQRLSVATDAYLEFLEQGGELRLEDLTVRLIREHLRRGTPILTGLSSTYLYRSPREFGPADDEDDIRGRPAGHFVVLCGYEQEGRRVIVADPFLPNPVSGKHFYTVNIERVVCAILLGIVTYDANLLIVRPPPEQKGGRPRVRTDRRQ